MSRNTANAIGWGSVVLVAVFGAGHCIAARGVCASRLVTLTGERVGASSLARAPSAFAHALQREGAAAARWHNVELQAAVGQLVPVHY